ARVIGQLESAQDLHQTGVSAGALIAPYAFLGPEWDSRLRVAFIRCDRSSTMPTIAHRRGGCGRRSGTPMARAGWHMARRRRRKHRAPPTMHSSVISLRVDEPGPVS